MHEEMLRDKVRTEAYRDSIIKNKHLFKDKVILDVGTGTSILSLFAVRYGEAKMVHAVEMADIHHFARDIVHRNGYSDKITVHNGKIEDMKKKIKANSVDVIISEWMGYFLLYESMLDSILAVRDYFLKPRTGMIWPNKATMHVAAIEDQEFYQTKVRHWTNVYEFDMSCMQTAVIREA
jgi:protein arginine N-methyltransferase 1